MPAVSAFLWERRLTLSEEQTLITSSHQGLDFLGFKVRKYDNKRWVKPGKNSTKSFLEVIREEIKQGSSTPMFQFIRALHRKITGWVNYHRPVVAKQTFSKVDAVIYRAL